MDIGEQDTGLGGLLRSSSIKKPNPNNMIEMNLCMGMNLNRNTANFNDMRMSGVGGKQQIKLSNFLGADFFGEDDEDDEDDDTSGLFSRPNRMGNRPGGIGMSMVPIIPQNNMLLNNNMNNNPLMMNNKNLINPQNINPNLQMNNVVLRGVELKIIFWKIKLIINYQHNKNKCKIFNKMKSYLLIKEWLWSQIHYY